MAYVINYPRQKETQSDTTITQKASIHSPFLTRFKHGGLYSISKFLNFNQEKKQRKLYFYDTTLKGFLNSLIVKNELRIFNLRHI